MPVRLDTKTILSMFNQSKLAAEEAIDKQRMENINRALEEHKMADEKSYRDSQIALQNRAADEAKLRGDQSAAWHEADTKERATWHSEDIQRLNRQDVLTAQRYKDDVTERSRHDQALEAQGQGMLSYYNRMADIAQEKVELGPDGKPLTKSQMDARQTEASQKLKVGLAKDLHDAMGGLNFNTNPSDAFSKGAQSTHDEMQRTLTTSTNILDVLDKYDTQGYPASALNQSLIKKINDRLAGSSDWLKTIHQVKEDPNVSVVDATGLYPGLNAMDIKPRVPVVPQEKKDALFDMWNDVNARLSQRDPSGMSAAGYVTDPATGKQYKIK